MVTMVQAQLEEMAGGCNELHRLNRKIMFIVPIHNPSDHSTQERSSSHVAIFSLPNDVVASGYDK